MICIHEAVKRLLVQQSYTTTIVTLLGLNK